MAKVPAYTVYQSDGNTPVADPTDAQIIRVVDIYVSDANGDVHRLQVGADGTHLTADSTTALGVKWA